MRNKLICYIEGLFEGVPDTPQVRELKEEILQNTLDRYDEECSKGAAETVAYNTAVMSIGDVDGLLAEFRSPKKEKKGFRRVCLAIAIALYILCVVPPIIADALGWPDAVGASLMFLLIAAATVLLVLRGGREKTEPVPAAEPVSGTPVQTAACPGMNAAPAQQGGPRAGTILRRVLTPIYWVAAVCLFLAVGFMGRWYVAWVIFPLAGGLGDVISGIVYMAMGRHGAKKFVDGILLLAAVAVYLKISCDSGAWWITWLVFPIDAALTGIVSGIFTLATGGKQ